MSAPPTILFIAAESDEREGLAEMLERRGHVLMQVEQAVHARAILDGQPNRNLVIVLDLARPEALRFLRAPMVQREGIPVIICAAAV